MTVDPVKDMAIFDRLPQVVKDALRKTVREYTAEAAMTALLQGNSPQAVARFIEQMDRERTQKEWNSLYHEKMQ